MSEISRQENPPEGENPEPGYEKVTISVVCSGCQKDMGTKVVEMEKGYKGNVSHSMCTECLKKNFPELY